MSKLRTTIYIERTLVMACACGKDGGDVRGSYPEGSDTGDKRIGKKEDDVTGAQKSKKLPA